MAQNTIILATRNAGKIRELAEPLAAHGLRVVGLDAFPDMPEVEETGATFEENALLKAEAAARHTGCVAVADDSGLEVDALEGRPGVFSARYADDWPALEGESRDGRNIRKLLHELEGVPAGRRGCRFVCCMAACKPDGTRLTVRGAWEGRILDAPRGDGGFGYDPVFWDGEGQCSAAELTREQKNARSHRGAALKALLAAWPAFYGQ
ncbi:MAG: RdgB/HAM1 family non-canonical purine NTP pyrophosphatase [Desulfovibrionaceae bacterium]